MLYMTNQTMKVFAGKLNEHSTMLPLPLPVQLEGRLKQNCTMNWDLNPSNSEAGLDDSVLSLK